MQIDVLPVDQLSSDHLDAWSELQRSDWILRSPFFSPELCLAAAEVRDEVQVAIFRQDGEYVGFLPFHCSKKGVGTPVGDRVSELQGPVVAADFLIDGEQFLQQTGLSAWKFDCAPAQQEGLRQFSFSESESPYIDISGGFEAYRKERRSAGSSQID